ncbi:spermatogenesis-associated protein 6 isoform X2 [Hetaerina americana]|uniref:spermatogenesis-associated protein 6 isoform X2 n=1 Tax=Hetaerina americana TaxID=62018 RepID=UPI003A7F4CDC
MCTKGFKVVIVLDIHAVTCPGVWLCPNGKVRLKTNILGFSSKTKCLPPIFPLLFHEQFVFEKLISTCHQLTDLQKYFGNQRVFLELIQKSGSNFIDEIVLATFEIALIDLLYPSTSHRGILTGVDVDLLMQPSCHFPGIIAPKVEISTKTTVEEISISSLKSKKGYINPKTLRSKATQKQVEPCMKPKLARQGHCNVFYHGHPVCHCCLEKNDRPPFVVRKTEDCGLSKCSGVANTFPQLPALPCHRWGGKKLICRHFKDEDWHKKQLSKDQEKICSHEANSHLQMRPLSSGTLKPDCCECVASHTSGSCGVCNLYKKYFPKYQRESNASSKYICQSDIDLSPDPQQIDECCSSDGSSEAPHLKGCNMFQPEKTKHHFTDYTSSSRLTSELSRRVRHATDRVDYPFLQTCQGKCRCGAHHVHK